MLFDKLEIYRRGDEDAPRPECCPPPFGAEFHNWMVDYPQAYVIPVGEGQRSDAEANRLVEWLLFNDIEVNELERDYRFGSQTFEEGSYVVWMAQPRRGLADTAMSLGVDISDRIQRLYAPPAAWSHGYLWGADVVTIPDGARFSPRTEPHPAGQPAQGLGADRGRGQAYTLQIDSPTAVRALNELVRGGAEASLATAAFSGGPAGTALFGGDRDDAAGARRRRRASSALTFGRARRGALPSPSRSSSVPRFAVIALDNPPTGSTIRTRAWIRASGCCASSGSTPSRSDGRTLNTRRHRPAAGLRPAVQQRGRYPSATNRGGR